MFGTTDRQGMDGGGGNAVNVLANDGTGTVTFTQNMVVGNFASNYGVLYFGGTNTGDNTFSGNIGDTSGSSKFAIGKFGTANGFFREPILTRAIRSFLVGYCRSALSLTPRHPAARHWHGDPASVGNNGVNGTYNTQVAQPARQTNPDWPLHPNKRNGRGQHPQ